MSRPVRVSIVWERQPDGTDVPFDRNGRTAAQCRKHADQVAGLIDDLLVLVGRIDGAGIGREREVGSKFDKRWNLQVVAMRRLVARDLRHASWLDKAIAEEAERQRQFE